MRFTKLTASGLGTTLLALGSVQLGGCGASEQDLVSSATVLAGSAIPMQVSACNHDEKVCTDVGTPRSPSKLVGEWKTDSYTALYGTSPVEKDCTVKIFDSGAGQLCVSFPLPVFSSGGAAQKEFKVSYRDEFLVHERLIFGSVNSPDQLTLLLRTSDGNSDKLTGAWIYDPAKGSADSAGTWGGNK